MAFDLCNGARFAMHSFKFSFDNINLVLNTIWNNARFINFVVEAPEIKFGVLKTHRAYSTDEHRSVPFVYRVIKSSHDFCDRRGK